MYNSQIILRTVHTLDDNRNIQSFGCIALSIVPSTSLSVLRLNLFPTIIRDISTVLFPRFTLCSVLLLYYRSSFSTACLLTCIVFKFYNEIALTFSSYLFICRCILNLFRMQIQIPNVSVECKYNNGYRFYYVFYDRIFIIYCLVPLRSIREK